MPEAERVFNGQRRQRTVTTTGRAPFLVSIAIERPRGHGALRVVQVFAPFLPAAAPFAARAGAFLPAAFPGRAFASGQIVSPASRREIASMSWPVFTCSSFART